MTEWIDSDSLRKHLLGVEAAMRAYARKWDEDEELYAVTGLVHDLDYERYPDLETGHPRYAIKELKERGYSQEVMSGWRYTVVIGARRPTVWQRLTISFEHGEAGHHCFAWKAVAVAGYCAGDVGGERRDLAADVRVV